MRQFTHNYKKPPINLEIAKPISVFQVRLCYLSTQCECKYTREQKDDPCDEF